MVFFKKKYIFLNNPKENNEIYHKMNFIDKKGRMIDYVLGFHIDDNWKQIFINIQKELDDGYFGVIDFYTKAFRIDNKMGKFDKSIVENILYILMNNDYSLLDVDDTFVFHYEFRRFDK